MKGVGGPDVGLRIELDSTGAPTRGLARLDSVSRGADGTGRKGDESRGRDLHGEMCCLIPGPFWELRRDKEVVVKV